MTPLDRLKTLGFRTELLNHIISRIDPLDDYSALDSVLHNLHGALVSLERHLPHYLPPPLLPLVAVLREINRYIAQVGIATIGTTSDSGRLEIANQTYGRFANTPLYAAFAEDSTELSPNARERIHLCLGLLLLTRVGLGNPPSPTRKLILIADGLRKAISNEAWSDARDVIPDARGDFLSQLKSPERLETARSRLPHAQHEFLAALATLADAVSSTTGVAPIHGINLRLLDDDEVDVSPTRLITYIPGYPDEELGNEDITEPIEFVETPSTPARKSKELREHQLQRIAVRGAQRFVRDNQFLSRHWRTLFDPDTSILVSEARAILNGNESLHRKRQAVLSSLVLLTSHSPTELASFVLAKSLNKEKLDTCMSAHVIDVERSIWWHMWPALPGRFQPEISEEPFLQPHVEWVPLALPPELCSALSFEGSTPALLSNVLSASLDDLESLFRGFCRSLRGRSTHISPARIRAQGFDYLVRKTGDDSFACAIQGTLEYAPYSPLYYFSCSAQEAIDAHASRLTSLGWTLPANTAALPSHARFGSRLQPTAKVIADLVGVLVKELDAARTAYAEIAAPKSIARLHNAMTLYMAVMAISATGHRKAHEYSFVRWTLDLLNLFLMASDKILSTALSTRLVAIPRMLAEQFQAFVEHLIFLASRVTRYNPELAARIRSLVQPDAGRDAIPLLFLLDDHLSEIIPLTHEELRKQIGAGWPLPWHAARHLLESATRAHGMSAEFNHYRAGHISSGQQPFSATSPLVPEEVVRRSAEIVDSVLADRGWSVQQGLTGRRRNPSHFEREAARQLGPAYLPAPILRAQSLMEQSAATVVTSVITAFRITSGKKGSLDDEDVAVIRQEILKSSADQPFLAAERLNLFRKMLLSGRKTGEFRLRNLPGLAAQDDERPAFAPDAAWRIRQAEAWRQGFLDYLALHPATKPEDAIDCISFCLIAFAAFTAPSTVGMALRACFSQAFTLEGFLWVELPRRIKEEDENAREWIRRPLDPVTTCLLLQARQRYGTDISAALISYEAVTRSVLRLARKIAGYARVPVEVPESLRAACEIFVPLFRFRLPGIHAAWCEGRLVSVSLARPDFLRLMIGQRPIDSGALPEANTDEIALVARPNHRSMTYVKARKLMRRIGQILVAARPDGVSGGKDATHYAQKQSKARKDLKTLVPALQIAPFVVQALAAWIEQLLMEGGKVKDRLQASTIATYFWAIAYPLVEIMLDEDMAILDSAQLEDLYTEVLDARARKMRIRRARVLRQFHHSCCARYGLPEVDWYDIEPLIDSNTDYIDANLVTPSEYRMAMDALRPHIDDGKIDALKLAVVALIMYRAGLRMGEVFRLTLDDIILDGEDCVLLIRANRYGRPKTHNGWRRIHIGWRIPAAERGLIERLIAYRRRMCGEAPETALFGSTALPHELDARRPLESKLTELLRWATGRAMIRPHHLRHGMASFCTVSQFALPEGSLVARCVAEYLGGADNPGKALRQELLGRPEPTRRIMHAICAETGHGLPLMLLMVYGNTLDIGLACHLRASVKETLGDSDDNDLIANDRGTRSINKYERAAALSGLSDGRLRRLMHDGRDITNPSVLAEYLVSRYPISHGVPMMPHGETPCYEPAWARTTALSLEQVHGIISAAVSGAETRRIATTWGTNEKQTGQIISSAKQLAAHCRYARYGTKSLRYTWTSSEQPVTQDTPPMPTRNKGGDTYERFSIVPGRLDDPFVQNGLQAWIRCYRPSEHGLACEDIEDLAAFWCLLLALGYAKERLVITLPPMSADVRKGFGKRLSEIGISGEHIEFSRRGYLNPDPGIEAIVPTLLIKRSKDSPLRSAALSMTTLHQCCYLCAVLLGVAASK